MRSWSLEQRPPCLATTSTPTYIVTTSLQRPAANWARPEAAAAWYRKHQPSRAAGHAAHAKGRAIDAPVPCLQHELHAQHDAAVLVESHGHGAAEIAGPQAALVHALVGSTSSSRRRRAGRRQPQEDWRTVQGWSEQQQLVQQSQQQQRRQPQQQEQEQTQQQQPHAGLQEANGVGLGSTDGSCCEDGGSFGHHSSRSGSMSCGAGSTNSLSDARSSHTVSSGNGSSSGDGSDIIYTTAGSRGSIHNSSSNGSVHSGSSSASSSIDDSSRAGSSSRTSRSGDDGAEASSSSSSSSSSSRRAALVPEPLRGAALPKHVALIMDGNARWASRRGLATQFGHQAGLQAFKSAVNNCDDWGIQALTVFAFSSENWQRDSDEVSFLLQLVIRALQQELQQLHSRNICFRAIGQLERLPLALQRQVQEAERLTAANRGMQLTVALSYSGQQDIVTAMQRIAQQVAKGRLQPHQIDRDVIESHLALAPVLSQVGPPDLLIRTSGEQRLSNFLLWESAYTELVFSQALFPDFGKQQLVQALAEYQGRVRRFGARKT